MMKRSKYILVLILLAAGVSLSAQTLKDAIKLTDSEQYEAATTAFQNLVKAQPANGTIYYYFGENYLMAENKDSAKIIFLKGLEADPANALNTIGLAKIELDNGSPEKGNKMIEEALQKAGSKN